MFITPYNKNEDIAEIRDFIRKNGFGILLNTTNDRLHGTHIPIVLETDADGNDILHGHIARANPQWQNFQSEAEILVIFNGPHAYVSSSWYNHENVPTWNYIAVHVYGSIKIIEGEALVDSLRKMTNKYEKGSKNPVSVDKLSEKTMRQVRGIVGFEISVTDIQATYKLSQNRKEEDYHQVVEKLEETQDAGAIAVAKEMQKKRDS
ncbi:MAG: transcriptional regulator [Saprospiraceae bacterium]|jgi:transcriptional regulator